MLLQLCEFNWVQCWSRRALLYYCAEACELRQWGSFCLFVCLLFKSSHFKQEHVIQSASRCQASFSIMLLYNSCSFRRHCSLTIMCCCYCAQHDDVRDLRDLAVQLPSKRYHSLKCVFAQIQGIHDPFWTWPRRLRFATRKAPRTQPPPSHAPLIEVCDFAHYATLLR
jgi:hypothetical protein